MELMILEIFLTCICLMAFMLIAFEEGLKINKAKSTLFLGTLVWIILFLFAADFGGIHAVEESFEENILEIAILWLFLIAAMTFVAYLDKSGFIENTVYKFLPRKISYKKLLFVIGIFAFFFSSVADNLTATLVSLTIILALNLRKSYLLPFSTFIIFAANAGGVSLITGDVTTLMIFLEGKVEMGHLLWLFIPSFISLMILYMFLSFKLEGDLEIGNSLNRFKGVDKSIAIIFISTIVMVILGHIYFHIPPVLTFLFGLSTMFLVGWIMILKDGEKKDNLKLLEYIREVEFDALFFFLGVLLLVGMLAEIGILGKVAVIYEIVPSVYANYFVGMLSAVVDNIPLTAAMLKAGISMGVGDWLAMTYAVGVGGSLLVIGSAAGVVAMCKIESLTFGKYLKNFFYIFIAYTVGFLMSHIVGMIIDGSIF